MILSALLALILSASLFAGCAKPDTPADTTGSPAAGSSGLPDGTTAGQTADSGYEPPAVIDTGRFVYRMLMKDNKLWVQMHFSESETENGDAINDALYSRETLVESLYNCEIEHTVDSNAATLIANASSAGDPVCEAIFMPATTTFSGAVNGLLLDLNTVDGFRTDAPWWDARVIKEYAVGPRLFTLDGEINIRDDLRTMGVIYNKELYNDYGYNATYGKPYDIVSAGNWTYEMLMEMIKDKTADPNDTKGMWGMLSEVSAPYYFFLGSGLKTLTNEGGEFTCHLAEEKVSNFFQKTALMASNRDIMIVNNGNYFSSSEQWTAAVNIFKSGNCLFRSTTLSSVNGLTDMKSDYGILPVPNSGGGSREYYCYASGSNTSPLSMPRNLADTGYAVAITEALAYYSLLGQREGAMTLHGAFYSILGDARLARTFEDIAMLDIVFSSKTYDIDQAAAITGFESAFYQIVKGGGVSGVATAVTVTSKSANAKLAKFLADLDGKYAS